MKLRRKEKTDAAPIAPPQDAPAGAVVEQNNFGSQTLTPSTTAAALAPAEQRSSVAVVTSNELAVTPADDRPGRSATR